MELLPWIRALNPKPKKPFKKPENPNKNPENHPKKPEKKTLKSPKKAKQHWLTVAARACRSETQTELSETALRSSPRDRGLGVRL